MGDSRIAKLITGGQTGADRAALDAAVSLGRPYGGWVPKGRKTEDGPLHHSYKLLESESDKYEVRTEQNVLDSDATLIFSHGELTGGSKLTGELAQQHGRLWLHIDFNDFPGLSALPHITGWLREHHVRVLNVAGPRASDDPRIYRAVYAVVRGLLEIDQ